MASMISVFLRVKRDIGVLLSIARSICRRKCGQSITREVMEKQKAGV
jgi:hypothetical protein